MDHHCSQFVSLSCICLGGIAVLLLPPWGITAVVKSFWILLGLSLCLPVDDKTQHSHVTHATVALLSASGTAGAITGSDMGVLTLFLCLFHLGEFGFVCYTHPSSCSWHGLLLSSTWQYNVALLLSTVENDVVAVLLPLLGKETFWWDEQTAAPIGAVVKSIRVAGLVCVTAGLSLRWWAFASARHNFSHFVRDKPWEHMQLCTHGAYKWCRHPGYLGWFIMSIGQQIMVRNFLCAGFFYYVIARYFRSRCVWEECCLRKLFGPEYDAYAKLVPSFLPGLEEELRRSMRHV